MSQKEKKKNMLFIWLAKGTRDEPWPTAQEIRETEDFKNLQEIGKKLVEGSNKKKEAQ